MLALNAASVVERALRSVARSADEISLVDTGSSDGTPEMVERLARDLGKIDVQCIRLRPDTHPGLYFQDLPSSWKRTIPGPFTGLPILKDWSHARNLGLENCRGDWILKLDADDECMTPGGLQKTIQQLAKYPNIDYLACPYEIMNESPAIETIAYQDRLWRNKASIRFHLPLHERLLGENFQPGQKPNRLISAAGLRFRDWRDSIGLGVRIARRNFKILLAERERRNARGEELDPKNLYDLAGEAITADPAFALELLESICNNYTAEPKISALWHNDIARAHQACGNTGKALSSYRTAIEINPQMTEPRLRLGLLELEMGHDGWRNTLKTAIKVADEAARFNISLPDLRKAQGLIGSLTRS
jgi:glycosyltransferase involved in cell wall biosynthesis